MKGDKTLLFLNLVTSALLGVAVGFGIYTISKLRQECQPTEIDLAPVKEKCAEMGLSMVWVTDDSSSGWHCLPVAVEAP